MVQDANTKRKPLWMRALGAATALVTKRDAPTPRGPTPASVFFQGFLEHPKMVGSVIPSSKTMIADLLDPIDWNSCELFVEYGPGVGTMTSHILERLPAQAKLLAIDTNPRFIEFLEESFDDERLHARLGSATQVEQMVREIGHEKANYVLSGLPFSGLTREVGKEIVQASHKVLREGGAFMTYQLRANARDLTQEVFGTVDKKFTFWNFPPCILTWGWKGS